MNYYPNNNNYYPNYNYQPQQQIQQQMMGVLQGKVVDSIEMVRVNEVPFGGFGVFPKGDLTEVYIKSWNNNGTTQINTYKLIPAEETREAKENSSKNELLEKINVLNQKLDLLMNTTPQQQVQKQAASDTAKEVKINAY